jgi:pimeloyl-ACP methyl ester carboxylesterase
VNVVLLHALPLDERMWEPQREALEGHEVTTPNLYRLGRSVDEWATRVLGMVEGRFAAVGASMGGYCALALARIAAERLAGLALVSSRAGADSPERRVTRDRMIRLVGERGVEALWDELRPNLLPEDAATASVEHAWGIAMLQETDDLVVALEAIRDRPDSTDVVRTFPAPLLVVAGDNDPLLPLAEARATAAAAPHGRLAVVERTGHLPSLERPEEFNAALVEFLAELR